MGEVECEAEVGNVIREGNGVRKDLDTERVLVACKLLFVLI